LIDRRFGCLFFSVSIPRAQNATKSSRSAIASSPLRTYPLVDATFVPHIVAAKKRVEVMMTLKTALEETVVMWMELFELTVSESNESVNANVDCVLTLRHEQGSHSAKAEG
jgi:hypothetical protein